MGEQTSSQELEALRAAMKPMFDERRAVWDREGPAVMARAAELGIAFDSKGGNCPVQAEGWFDDKRFYFRARGDGWSLNVWAGSETYGKAANPDEWIIDRDYGDGFDAGWMPLHEAIGFVCEGVAEHRAALATGAT